MSIPYNFKAAIPVWEEGTTKQMNRSLSFCYDLNKTSSAVLALTASSSFVILVNGNFVAHGPARCAHGFFRVDEYELAPYLTEEINRVTIRVVGYNVNSYCYLNQPSFLVAEIISNGEVLAATGVSDFECFATDERIIKTQRFSFQRTFVEAYNFTNAYPFEYEQKCGTVGTKVFIAPTQAGNFIAREIPYSSNEVLLPQSAFQCGTVSYSEKEKYYNGRELTPKADFITYKLDELEVATFREAGKLDFSTPSLLSISNVDEVAIKSDSYVDLDWGVNYSGIYAFTIEAEGDGELFVIFDEILSDNQIYANRLGASQLIHFKLQKGICNFISAEPYVMRYTRLVAKGTDITVKKLRLYHIAFPYTEIKTKFIGNDERMEKIYSAAIETFRANAVDIYMDCPSRERAGWLCDSFFTSRVEFALTGKATLEKCFLENFILPERFEFLPEGMLPMCYPADHNDKTFIPNWAMWYVLELREYFHRTRDAEFIERAKPRMYALLNYFKRFENEYSLLENLESWIFVEWSRCNSLVRDVSFPSNMVYSEVLNAMAELYGDASLAQKAQLIKENINKLAMTPSGFYCDNAVRNEAGELVLSGERTEACQYYAFFTNVATPTNNPELWKILVNDFGYARAEKGLYPEIWPANAFIGNYLRLDLLNRYGYKEELYDNIKGYFYYMAERTGTLWENVGAEASCNHGFASHVIYWQKALGLLA